MLPPARFAAIATTGQWLDCAHTGTALFTDSGVITLAWTAPVAVEGGPGLAATPAPVPAGLVIDAGHYVYHGMPDEGRIVRLAWRPGARWRPDPAGRDATDLLAPPERGDFGAFTPSPDAGRPTVRAVALALGADDRLAVLDATTGEILLLDLRDRRLSHRVALPARAVDLAAGPPGLLVLTADPQAPLWSVAQRRRPVPVPVTRPAGVPGDAVPVRAAVGEAGEIWLLWRAPDHAAWAAAVNDPRADGPLGPFPGATDLELDGAAGLVVAGPAGLELSRFTPGAGADSEATPLRARGYDGRGLARAPDGSIVYWSTDGPRIAYPAPVRYRLDGHVDTFALDAGGYRRRWGRLFIDACLPSGTSLTVECATADELPSDEGLQSLPLTRPDNIKQTAAGRRSGPPLVAGEVAQGFGDGLPPYRRGESEQPWYGRASDDPFVTYEAPVIAPPGRYLWLRLRLRGKARVAPRIRAVRVETSSHGLVDRLPRVYTEDSRAAAFLDRYLAVLHGPLGHLADGAAHRHLLLRPDSAPADLLPWLASLVGLTLDARWPDAARRTMYAEAVDLFRRRGTVGALLRMLEIYLGVPPILVERFRFRGSGGVGSGGFVVGGRLGVGGPEGGQTIGDAREFEAYAHRFSVMVPRWLTSEQSSAVRHLLDLHRPAHTLVELCTVGDGMRVGIGLHLELTSVVGRSGGFAQFAVGDTPLGPGTVLGQATGGYRVGGGRLGQDTRVDP